MPLMGALKAFDRKFGADFIGTVPCAPGVYRMISAAGEVVYVGKAKNLRRRLGQYRNARRCKADGKMRKIVASAARLEFEICESELAACLLEVSLIQELRPKWNVAGAFSFLYPMIGLARDAGTSWFCFTTAPETVSGYSLQGAYRSREIAGDAFFAWMRLLQYVGHPAGKREREKRREGTKRCYLFGFRSLPEDWFSQWELFFKGESPDALEHLVFALLENAAARSRARQIQEDLNALRRFWKHEATLLLKARQFADYRDYPVPQKDRDPLLLRYRAKDALAKECLA